MIEHLLPLTIPVPPMFERALGSPGPLSHPDAPAARYCAFYWTEAGDEAAFDDGQQSGAGMLNNDAYLAFVQHPAIAPHLQHFTLGSSEAPADHWLILDRQQHQFFVVPVGVAKPLVEEQWEPSPEDQQGPLVVTLQDLEHALDALQQSNASWTETTTTSSTQAILEAMHEERRRCEELVAWLDAHAREQSAAQKQRAQ